jgi:hypothetical protein
VVLATQNPVDLDYKGLSNTGTWFLGRLQTERDKARVLEGLEGVAAGGGARFDRQAMEETLAGLGKRVFLLNNVHEDGPVVFETRWVMSYLRGPLTRDQIKTLMDPHRGAVPAAAPAASKTSAAAAPRAAAAGSGSSDRPVLPPNVPQYFVPFRGSAPEGQKLVYHPTLLAASKILFDDRKSALNVSEDAVTLVPLSDEAVAVDWDAMVAADIDPADLEKAPAPGARFAPLPAIAAKSKSYTAWKREMTDWLYRNRTLELLKSSQHKEYSQPNESERDFRIRLGQAVREERDAALEKLRKKYSSKITTVEERIRRAQQAVEREAEQAKQHKVQTAISFGATLLTAMVGRKLGGRSSVGRATTAARGVSRSMKEAQDVGRARETVEAQKEKLEALEVEFQAETEELKATFDPQQAELETVSVRPKKKDIAVKMVALGWAPHWEGPGGAVSPAWE